MKKNACLFLFLTLLFLICGCVYRDYTYEFDQPIENIEKVEIMTYDENTNTTSLLKELEKEEYTSLLHSITKLSCGKYFGDGMRFSVGKSIIYITYVNGSAEVIGYDNNVHINSSGEWEIDMYYFNDNEFYDLLSDYIDRDLLPSITFEGSEMPQ